MEQFEHHLGYIDWLTAMFYSITGSMGLHLSHANLEPLWMTLFIVLFWSVFLAVYKKKLSVFPTPVQQGLEVYYKFVANLAFDIIGPEAKKYVPLLGTLGLFILSGNLFGLIPIFKSPTGSIQVTLACALVVFIYYHLQGIREQGFFKYLKHFAGEVWWLAPIFVPIEIISHFARPLTLSIRLFGNIFSEDAIIMILFGLVPYFVPLPIMCLAVFTSLIQTYVFLMLASVYIGGAVAHDHDHGEEHEESDELVALAQAH